MKGVACFAVALVLFAYWLKVKDDEKTRVRRAVYQHVVDACGDISECHVRIQAGFEPCFDFAYFGGVLPGRGTVDMKEFARCFNYDRITFKLLVVDGKAPFPAR